MLSLTATIENFKVKQNTKLPVKSKEGGEYAMEWNFTLPSGAKYHKGGADTFSIDALL